MENKSSIKRIESNNYIHIYLLLKKIFNFNENKYGNYIKDVLRILLDSEKNGETFIDIDQKIYNNLEKEGWPEEHLNALEEAGLINLPSSPFIFKNNKISLIKWTKKIEKILDLLSKKININSKRIQAKELINQNESAKILKLFEISDLVLLQGGPGTGKSTLIVNLILSFLSNNINIGIAAPTGKASARIKEYLEKHKNKKDQLDKIECQTLHRWIYNSLSRNGKLKYKLNELDLFIIDEMSMVNINLIESVLNLLAHDCKLLLVGDANQLPPINSCSVWNYIFTQLDNCDFKDNTINLTKVYRNNGDIENLSKLIFSKNNDLFNSKVNQLINQKKSNKVQIIKSESRNIPIKLADHIRLHLNDLKKSVSILSNSNYIFTKSNDNLIIKEKDLTLNIFKKLNSHIVLCQRNSGIWGVNDINKIIINQTDSYDFLKLEEGIPIMCTENNEELGISNGDIGVLIGKDKHRRFLFRKFNKFNNFVAALIEPDKLANIVPALAITIHKSQGSEAKKVSILWNQKNDFDETMPNDYFPEIFFRNNFDKRLLYTGITRARENLDIYYLK